MERDLRWRVHRPVLELQTDPSMPLLVTGVAARGYGVGEREEGRPVASDAVEALHQQLVLVVQHRLQPLLADVPLRGPVDRVADLHVIGRDGLRDRARGPADVEEPAHHFLARADLGEGSVDRRVDVDLQRFVVTGGALRGHGARLPAYCQTATAPCALRGMLGRSSCSSRSKARFRSAHLRPGLAGGEVSEELPPLVRRAAAGLRGAERRRQEFSGRAGSDIRREGDEDVVALHVRPRRHEDLLHLAVAR